MNGLRDPWRDSAWKNDYGRYMRLMCSAAVCLLAAFITGACSGPRYVPDITLTQTEPIIDARAEFHDLYPTYPLLSGTETFGLDAPDAERIEPAKLTEQIETQLVKALDGAGVFSRVTRFDPNPDLILAGRINALHEHNRPRVWSKLPYVGPFAQMFALKTHLRTGKADVTLFVLKPNGETAGIYRGTSTFQETFNPTIDVPPGARLNRALSEAIRQIQTQISRDAQLRTIATR